MDWGYHSPSKSTFRHTEFANGVKEKQSLIGPFSICYLLVSGLQVAVKCKNGKGEYESKSVGPVDKSGAFSVPLDASSGTAAS
uniref:Uncharacterized protein n=1 Tax=Aegilops tauschii subsp. strangulata TaxID=200361 RepID=A0A453IIT1_AEGTS